MNNNTSLGFPDLILLEEYAGNFELYFDEIYKIFVESFISTQPLFNNQRVTAQKYPEVDGIHKTFYHITHEGEDELNRTADFRRMERIKFPKFMIDNVTHSEVLMWENKRGRDKRVLLFNESENYLVVLTERKGYYLFCTAYLVEREHRKRKLLREYEEYEEYVKTKTA